MDESQTPLWQTKLGLTPAEASKLDEATVLERLIDAGVSKLTAARMLEVERVGTEPGRARRHGGQRR